MRTSARKTRSDKGKVRVHFCPAGHRYTKRNTYIYVRPDGCTQRQCRKCHIERQRVWRATH